MSTQVDQFDTDDIDEIWARLKAEGYMDDIVDEEEAEDGQIEKEPDEIYCPYDEDLLAYWGSLRMAGWELEEMLSQGMIDPATYFDNEEPKLPKESASEIVFEEYTPEEIEKFEIIYI